MARKKEICSSENHEPGAGIVAVKKKMGRLMEEVPA